MRNELEDTRVAGPLADAELQPVLEAAPEEVLAQVLPARTLPHLTFYFDVVSPYACLAFERLPEVLAGLSYSVSYQPVFLGAILKHWGQKGPAEVAPKRAWMIRQVHWLARQYGLAGWQWPSVHPFNSLPLLRLAMACGPGPGGTPILVAGYEGFTGRSWAELSAAAPATRDFVTLLFRMFGVFIVAFALMAIAIAATAFRRGERWTWWMLLVGNTIAYGAPMTYDRIVGAIGPFELSEYLGIAVIYVALASTMPLPAGRRTLVT